MGNTGGWWDGRAISDTPLTRRDTSLGRWGTSSSPRNPSSYEASYELRTLVFGSKRRCYYRIPVSERTPRYRGTGTRLVGLCLGPFVSSLAPSVSRNNFSRLGPRFSRNEFQGERGERGEQHKYELLGASACVLRRARQSRGGSVREVLMSFIAI